MSVVELSVRLFNIIEINGKYKIIERDQIWGLGATNSRKFRIWTNIYSATSLSGESGIPPLQNIPRLACVVKLCIKWYLAVF